MSHQSPLHDRALHPLEKNLSAFGAFEVALKLSFHTRPNRQLRIDAVSIPLVLDISSSVWIYSSRSFVSIAQNVSPIGRNGEGVQPGATAGLWCAASQITLIAWNDPVLISTGSAGISELAVFHPVSFFEQSLKLREWVLIRDTSQVDTIAKRLMSNETRVRKIWSAK